MGYPAATLPNNVDYNIKGLFYIRETENPKLRYPTEETTVIYTDGSTENMYSGAGVYIPTGPKQRAIKTGCPLLRPTCILDAELEAIKHALKHVLYKKDLQKPKIVIYTDSLVALDLIMRFHNPSSIQSNWRSLRSEA